MIMTNMALTCPVDQVRGGHVQTLRRGDTQGQVLHGFPEPNFGEVASRPWRQLYTIIKWAGPAALVSIADVSSLQLSP